MGRKRTPFERSLHIVLDEEAAYDGFDSEFAPNPHDPWAKATAELARPEYVALLAAVVDQKASGAKWAVHALATLGAAARAAAPVLERRGEWLALFAVDEARARELALHVRTDPVAYDETVRAAIAAVVKRRGPAEVRAHFADLLRRPEPDVTLFALDGSPSTRDRSHLIEIAAQTADAVPIAEVRAYAEVGAGVNAQAAARILAEVHWPEDARRVLSVARRGLAVRGIEWIAPTPFSDALIERANPRDLYQLVRRRRCAGLATNVGQVRRRVLDVLAPAPRTKAWNDDAARAMDLGHAAKIVAELRDVECADALVEAIGPREPDLHEARFDDVAPTLVVLGDAGDAALARGLARFTGDRRQRVEWMIEAVATHRARATPYPALSDADAKFAAGDLEDWLLGTCAWDYYARVLLREPANAHAAFQLAWIDRGLGSPMAPERIEWLRTLGVPDDLLVDLARRPTSILGGSRYDHRGARPRDEARAREAEGAGLFGVAAKYWGAGTPDARRCDDETHAHLDRVVGIESAG